MEIFKGMLLRFILLLLAVTTTLFKLPLLTVSTTSLLPSFGKSVALISAANTIKKGNNAINNDLLKVLIFKLCLVKGCKYNFYLNLGWHFSMLSRHFELFTWV
ncbi:hypothetical protein SDC9_92504 [bioreactor metagenome]|uniref:Uncharacterized protein n=1 Tax=bioreactor metagenome TaxID=1076179 RepID=A0A644ZYB4_9ZZZZ